MYLNSVVSILVGIFRVHTLGQWSESISQTGILLLLGALLWSEFALACNIIKSLVDIHIASCLIEYGASGIQFGLHA